MSHDSDDNKAMHINLADFIIAENPDGMSAMSSAASATVAEAVSPKSDFDVSSNNDSPAAADVDDGNDVHDLTSSFTDTHEGGLDRDLTNFKSSEPVSSLSLDSQPDEGAESISLSDATSAGSGIQIGGLSLSGGLSNQSSSSASPSLSQEAPSFENSAEQDSMAELLTTMEEMPTSELNRQAEELPSGKKGVKHESLSLTDAETRVGESPIADLSQSLSAMDMSASSEPASSWKTEAGGIHEMGSMAKTDELATVKRYAAIKEREVRERDSTVEALRKQLALSQSRLNASESERRRLSIKLSEAETTIRTFQDKLDSHQHHLSSSEATHRQEFQSLQLRFDNAQFLASKAQRKLEEFRDRVRADILKIRMRERELANRLELQKRDAEALLSAKDERLLQQKREIDRLEFELDTLKERLIDETAKAEERVGRLLRAVQSLKLAQGILSGMEEEVTPASRAKAVQSQLEESAQSEVAAAAVQNIELSHIENTGDGEAA